MVRSVPHVMESGHDVVVDEIACVGTGGRILYGCGVYCCYVLPPLGVLEMLSGFTFEGYFGSKANSLDFAYCHWN